MKKATHRKKELNDSVCAMKGVKVSSSTAMLNAPVPCYIYTRSGKLASYTLIIEQEEVKIMSKKKVKSTIPLDHCHAKIVEKVPRDDNEDIGDVRDNKVVEG